MTIDLVVDADSYTEQLGKQQDAFQRARERAELEIRTGFSVWFYGGDGRDCVVPCTMFHGPILRAMYQTATEAAHNAADYPDTIQAHNDLLQGRITVEQYRDALVNRYIEMQADDIAQLWAAS